MLEIVILPHGRFLYYYPVSFLRLQRKCGKRLNDLELANHVSIPVAKLSAILSKGAEAREKLVSSNIRLVISLAKQFSGRGLPLEDLVQVSLIFCFYFYFFSFFLSNYLYVETLHVTLVWNAWAYERH